MVPLLRRRLLQLLHRGGRRRDVRVAEAEVDDVVPCAAQLDLERVDGGKRVRRNVLDPPELPAWHSTRLPQGALRRRRARAPGRARPPRRRREARWWAVPRSPPPSSP